MEHRLKAASITISAANLAARQIRGSHKIYEYPRSSGGETLFLDPGSRVTISQTGRAVYLAFPPVFHLPGPHYGKFLGALFKYRIDGGPWKQLAMMEMPDQVPLAENLDEGVHRVEVESLEQVLPLKEFVFSPTPLAGVRGTIITTSYSELLTDVRMDTFSRGKLVRSDYVRNPVNGKFTLLGLEPGTYRFRFTAAGWSAFETRPVKIAAREQRDLGTITLKPIQILSEYAGVIATSFACGPGKSICVSPGGTFSLRLVPGIKQAQLVSPYKCIALQHGEETTMQEPGGEWPLTTFSVPADVPHDMYTLRLCYESAAGGSDYTVTHGRRHFPMNSPVELPQAVCIRDALSDNFHIAGMGHTNTWGQQNSEYLARVAETVQLAGARHFMISNEVNAAYISGALSELRIPYRATSGNHTMSRWDHFYGSRPLAVDDGPLRIVTFHDHPNHSWQEAARLIGARNSATNRIVLAWEAFAPLATIVEQKIDLLFAGHSYDEHPLQERFPTGTMRVRAPGSETLRWIPMTPHGLDPLCREPGDIPLLEVPRDGLSPLRVEYSVPNDGSAQEMNARIINEYNQAFPQARLRFVLRVSPSREYVVCGAQCIQTFISDDGKKCVLDVELAIAPESEANLQVCLQSRV